MRRTFRRRIKRRTTSRKRKIYKKRSRSVGRYKKKRSSVPFVAETRKNKIVNAIIKLDSTTTDGRTPPCFGST
jgi:hypothetical protein